MKKKMKVFTLVGIILISAVSMAACKIGNDRRATTNPEATEAVSHIIESDDNALAVNTGIVSEGELSLESTFAGTVYSDSTVNVITTVMGEVEEIMVKTGDYVEEGDVLFTINDDAAELSYDKAQATYNQAVAGKNQSVTTAQKGVIAAESSYNQVQSAKNAAVAKADEAVSQAQGALDAVLANPPALQPVPPMEDPTYESIVATNEALQKQYDDAVATATAAVNSATQAKDTVISEYDTQLDLAGDSLSNAKATVSATSNTASAQVESASIGIASAELGLDQYVIKAPAAGTVNALNVSVGNMATSSAVACSISKNDELQVEFYVSEYVKDGLEVGDNVRVSPNGVEFPGKVTHISPVVDAKTKLYTVTADVDATLDELPLNTSVKVRVNRAGVEDSIVIPYSALQFTADKTYVYTVSEGRAVQTQVEIGAFNETDVEIVSGLEAGEEIITSWSQSLRDGLAVSVTMQEDALGA